MKQTIIATLIASVVASAVGAGTAVMLSRPDVGVRQSGATVDLAKLRQNTRPNRLAWGELEQREIDALTAIVAKMSKKPLVIFCSDANCVDMALDFDNAFESAKWQTDIQRPFIDASEGIWASSQDIADAVMRATNGRLKVSVLGSEWRDPNKAALAIGRKPR